MVYPIFEGSLLKFSHTEDENLAHYKRYWNVFEQQLVLVDMERTKEFEEHIPKYPDYRSLKKVFIDGFKRGIKK